MHSGAMQAFVEAAVQAPSMKIQHLPIISSSARNVILNGFNDMYLSYPSDLCTSTLFEDRVKENPLAPCIRQESFSLHCSMNLAAETSWRLAQWQAQDLKC